MEDGFLSTSCSAESPRNEPQHHNLHDRDAPQSKKVYVMKNATLLNCDTKYRLETSNRSQQPVTETVTAKGDPDAPAGLTRDPPLHHCKDLTFGGRETTLSGFNQFEQKQQHDQRPPRMKYYRVVYRGVAALLSRPCPTSSKSGAYVSYGEIVASSHEQTVVFSNHCVDENKNLSLSLFSEPNATNSISSFDNSSKTTNSAPSSSLPLSPQTHHSAQAALYQYCALRNHPRHALSVCCIQVDDVLTGGYAVDATYGNASHPAPESTVSTNTTSSTSPPESEVDISSHTSPPSYDGLQSYLRPQHHRPTHHGYLFLTLSHKTIAKPLFLNTAPPPLLCHPGTFYYQVQSSTPLPILAGPCHDAPVLNSTALPMTVHEISLRMDSLLTQDDCRGPDRGDKTVFLRLSHRRGWIADRRTVPVHSHPHSRTRPRRSIIVMKEVTDHVLAGSKVLNNSLNDSCDVSYVSALSSASSFISTPSSFLNRRQRRTRNNQQKHQRKMNSSETLKKEEEEASISGTLIKRIDRRGTPNGKRWNNLSDVYVERENCRDEQAEVAGKFGITGTATSPIISDVSILSDSSFSNTIGHIVTNHVHFDAQLQSNETGETKMKLRAREQAGPVLPTVFLMRVTAPKGLKILDAPSFQVNDLIRGQAGHPSASTHSISTGGLKTKKRNTDSVLSSSHSISKNPFSIFHTMTGSFYNEANVSYSRPVASNIGMATPTASFSWEFDATGRTRILPRGTLFEASKRMEGSGVYTAGAGLIKLADETGWAIVPKKNDLDAQYQGYHGGVAGIREGEASSAFEEVGNGIVAKQENQQYLHGSQQQMQTHCGNENTAWVRIVQRNGVIITCPLPVTSYGGECSSDSPSLSLGSSSIGFSVSHLNGNGRLTSNESDVASSVGSLWLDAMFRSPKKLEAPLEAVGSRELNGHKEHTSLQPSSQMLVVPCGMCVKVDRWDKTDASSHYNKSSQNFVRLHGGQGWIPRMIHGEEFSVEINAPDVRYGSFWFRVQSKCGIKVRRGPSRRANSIRSEDKVYFRFECGEFLRASEVMTIFDLDHGDGNYDLVPQRSRSPPSESFAKLYRNNQPPRPNDSVRGLGNLSNVLPSHTAASPQPISSLVANGEWVQIHCNEEFFLQECSNPPAFERNQEGWRYNAVVETGVAVRKGPSFLSEKTGKLLCAGESVLINERVTAHGDRVTWLKLRGGLGWVHDMDESEHAVMIAHSMRHRMKPKLAADKASRVGSENTYHSLIANLFHSDKGSLQLDRVFR